MNPFLYPLLAYILGIGAGISFQFSGYVVLFIGFLCAGLGYFLSNRIQVKRSVFFMLIAFVCFGALRYKYFNERPYNHFSLYGNVDNYQVKVLREVTPSKNFRKYITHVEKVYTDNKYFKTSGLLLLYVSKTASPLVRSERIVFSTPISSIKTIKNPYTFDFEKHMANKRVYNQSFTYEYGVLKKQSKWMHFFKWKDKLSEKIAHHYNREVSLFCNSLILVNMSYIDATDKDIFSKAGIAHLFSISGLHVGIVFGFLWFLSYPFSLFHSRYRRHSRQILSLLGIWAFAAFAGFQPSVSRACFMFTLFVVSRIIQRPLTLNQTLVVSAFFLLLIYPNWVLDIGFQLSYVAVFFIGLFSKISLPYIRKQAKVLRYLLSGGVVSLSAQMGTMPLTIFYFHQFSFFGVWVNILIIPFVGVILIISFLVILFSMFNWYPILWVEIVNSSYKFLYGIMSYAGSKQPSYFNFIYWNILQVIFAYIGLIAFYKYLQKNDKKRILIVVSSILVIYGISWGDMLVKQKRNEIVFFYNRGKALIAIRNGLDMNVFYTDTLQHNNTYKYILQPYMIHERVDRMVESFLYTDYKYPSPQILNWNYMQININTDEFSKLNYRNKWKLNRLYIENLDSTFVWEIDKKGGYIYRCLEDTYLR